MSQMLKPETIDLIHRDRSRMEETAARLGVLLRGTSRDIATVETEILRLRADLENLRKKVPAPPEPARARYPTLPPECFPPWPPRPPWPPWIIPSFDPERIIPPRKQRPSGEVVCIEHQSLTAPAATYTEYFRIGSTDCAPTPQAPKTVAIQVSAGVSVPSSPGVSAAKCGFRSVLTFNTGYSGTVTIRSALNASIQWIEANAVNGGVSTAIAKASMSATLNSDPLPINAEEGTLASLDSGAAENHIEYASGLLRGSILEISLPIQAAGLQTVVVDEWVSAIVASSGALANIAMHATWDPVVAEVRGGCTLVKWTQVPVFGDYRRDRREISGESLPTSG